MNKTPFMIGAILFVAQLSIAQDSEVTTYFGEKCGFKIDFPADWSVALQEPKVMFAYNAMLNGIKGNAVVNLQVTYPCKNLKSEFKTWVGIFEKNAKKSNDANFKIHAQGEGKITEEKEFYYIEYTYTLVSDDGSSNIMHRKFITTCHRFSGITYSYAFFFETLEPDWSKFSTVYENIFSSVKYTPKGK